MREQLDFALCRRCRRPSGLVSYWFLCLGLASAVGCQPSWQAATHPVAGSLMVNGQPASGAVVTLYPVGEKVDTRNSKPWGVVDAAGEFRLQTYVKEDGAPAGEYMLTVKWPWDVNDMSQALSDRLGGRLALPDKSEIQVQVIAGDNQLEPIAIDGVRLATKPAAAGGRRVAGPPGPMTSR